MECFAGAAKSLVGLAVGVGKGAMRLGSHVRNRATPDLLTSQAGQPPKQTVISASTTVSEASVDDSLEPANNLPQGSAQHKPVSTQIVQAYVDSLSDVSSQLADVSSQAHSPGLTQPLQTQLKRVASTHVDAATVHLPVAFGMQSSAIKDWLLTYSGSPSEIASALQSFLTAQLGQSGHGAEAASWLYQQVLSAGSTCLASQATDVSRQRQYLDAAAEEVRQLSVQLKATDAIQQLTGGWNQGRQAEQNNEKVEALQKQIRQGGAPGAHAIQTPVSKKATDLDELSSSEDDDRADGAHDAFVLQLSARITQVQAYKFDPGQGDSILKDLTAKLEKVLKEKLSRLGDAPSHWRLISGTETCAAWKDVRKALKDSCDGRGLNAGHATECERYILAWAYLKNARDDHDSAKDRLASVLAGVKDLCNFDRSIHGWEDPGNDNFVAALAFIKQSSPPPDLKWSAPSAAVRTDDQAHADTKKKKRKQNVSTSEAVFLKKLNGQSVIPETDKKKSDERVRDRKVLPATKHRLEPATRHTGIERKVASAFESQQDAYTELAGQDRVSPSETRRTQLPPAPNLPLGDDDSSTGQ